MKLRLVLVCWVLAVGALEVAVNSVDKRCMVVYTVNEEDQLKIDIKFPKIDTKEQQSGSYLIELINSQTEEEEQWSMEMGTLRKQIKLTENVVYKLCILINLKNSGNYQMQEYIDYNTAIKHHGNVYEHQIIVPKSLLRVEDLHQSYKNLMRFNQSMETIRAGHNLKKASYDQVFVTQNDKIKQIEFISFIELAAICLLGAFQFLRLKTIIEHRQA